MDRLACIDVPDLPLQIVARRHPSWACFPLAVVERDAPQGLILWVNTHARRRRVRPGMRYTDALALAPGLRADVVRDEAIAGEVDQIVRCLQNLSPIVEPADDSPGVFWLSAAGLSLLYPTLHDWAHAVRKKLTQSGYRAAVVVGFTRFGTYAASRVENGIRVFESVLEEEKAAKAIALDNLRLAPTTLDMLQKLGVRTVATLLRLPATGLRERFGEQVQRLHRMASGDLLERLSPRPFEEPILARMPLDETVIDSIHLLFIVKSLLASLLERLVEVQEAIICLHIMFTLDTREQVIETVRPAEATLDASILLELAHLRFQATRLPAGVTEIEMRAETARATRRQLDLFAASRRRDLDAAARALARIRAEFGESSIVRARLREGHLPEAGFSWEPIDKPCIPQARRVRIRTLVRRIHTRPILLPPFSASERNEAWLGLDTGAHGSIMRLLGPYVVSGGWWATPIHREYHFVETAHGDLLWVYYDRRRRRWYLQGKVE